MSRSERPLSCARSIPRENSRRGLKLLMIGRDDSSSSGKYGVVHVTLCVRFMREVNEDYATDTHTPASK